MEEKNQFKRKHENSKLLYNEIIKKYEQVEEENKPKKIKNNKQNLQQSIKIDEMKESTQKNQIINYYKTHEKIEKKELNYPPKSPIPKLNEKETIPIFYNPEKLEFKTKEEVVEEKVISCFKKKIKIKEIFLQHSYKGINKEEFKKITRNLLNLPIYLNSSLFEKCYKNNETIKYDDFVEFY
jgi:flagellin-specific chaperone FliS